MGSAPRSPGTVRRLEDRGLVERFPCPEDGRATNARRHVIDTLTPEQIAQLADITEALLERRDPAGTMSESATQR